MNKTKSRQQELIVEEMRELSSYLDGIPEALRTSGAFDAYHARFNLLRQELLVARLRETLEFSDELLDEAAPKVSTEIPTEMDDDLRPEYDLSELLKDGVRGKYAERFRAGKNLVLLDPDVAQAFPNDDAVNETLRLVIQMVKPPIGGQAEQPPHAGVEAVAEK